MAARPRPQAMSEPPDANPPVTRTPEAVTSPPCSMPCSSAATSRGSICLAGRSWGCALMSITTVQNPGKVLRLMLYAPGWLRTTPSLINTAAARRLPHRDEGAGQGTLAQRRARAQAGCADPAGHLRAMVRCNVGHRSRWRKAKSAGGPRSERHRRRHRGELGIRQDHVRSGADHRSDPDRDRRVGQRHAALHGAGDLSRGL